MLVVTLHRAPIMPPVTPDLGGMHACPPWMLKMAVSGSGLLLVWGSLMLLAFAQTLLAFQQPAYPLKRTSSSREGVKIWGLEDSWVTRALEEAQRPKAITFPRPALDLAWAVLLMRSSYAMVDELDYTPMDQFQKEFFLLRQDEWQRYQREHPGIIQGDLKDPNYFDFISFAQYATISRGMKRGQMIFEEKIGANGESQTVSRDPALADNALLPREHSKRVGEAVLKKILETFGSSASAPRIEAGQSIQSLAENIDKLVGIFALNFYCIGYSTRTDGKSEIIVTVRAPATLWSQQVLAKRRDSPVNDFECKAILAYLEACGYQAMYSTMYRGIEIEHTFNLVASS